ncbi:MAG: hypothetical protein AAGJ35_06570, partial [Myxococcota bacterium]
PAFADYVQAALCVGAFDLDEEREMDLLVQPQNQRAILGDLQRFNKVIVGLEDESLRLQVMTVLIAELGRNGLSVVVQYWLHASIQDPLGLSLRQALLHIFSMRQTQAVFFELVVKLDQAPNSELVEHVVLLFEELLETLIRKRMWEGLRLCWNMLVQEQTHQDQAKVMLLVQKLRRALRSKRVFTAMLRDAMNPTMESARTLMILMLPDSLRVSAHYLLKSPENEIRVQQGEFFGFLLSNATQKDAEQIMDQVFEHLHVQDVEDAFWSLFADAARTWAPTALERCILEQIARFAQLRGDEQRRFWVVQALLLSRPRLRLFLLESLLERCFVGLGQTEEWIFSMLGQEGLLEPMKFLSEEIFNKKRPPAYRHAAIWMIGILPMESAEVLFEKTLFGDLAPAFRFQVFYTLWQRGRGAVRWRLLRRLADDDVLFLSTLANELLLQLERSRGKGTMSSLDDVLMAAPEVLSRGVLPTMPGRSSSSSSRIMSRAGARFPSRGNYGAVNVIGSSMQTRDGFSALSTLSKGAASTVVPHVQQGKGDWGWIRGLLAFLVLGLLVAAGVWLMLD